MGNMNDIVMRCIAALFLTLKLDHLQLHLRRLKNRIASNIECKKLRCNFKLHLQAPFEIFCEEFIFLEGSISSKPGLRIECFEKYNGDYFNPRLEIGKNVSFNSNCHIGCINHIKIGENVLIGSNVLIIDHSHGLTNDPSIPPSKRKLYSKGPIIIGSNTWIGENVCILPNVTIGENCIIGAGAVVSKNIPANCVAVGNPIRIINRD